MQLSSIASDVRLSLKLIGRMPRFFGLLLFILVLGIGSTTAMYSIVKALIWRPLPYPQSEQLVMLWGTRATGDEFAVSLRDVEDWQKARTLQKVGVAHSWLFSLASSGRPAEGLVGAQVSGGFFPTLGVAPLLGLLLGPEDDRVDAPPAVVIGEQLWRRRFGADPNVVGQSVLLDARPYTVVGVAPAGFDFSFPSNESVQVWAPVAVAPAYDWYRSSRNVREWYAMGRRRAGASIPDVQTELAGIARTAALGDRSAEPLGVSVVDLHEAVIGDNGVSVWGRFAAVALVFLVVCSNVSSLLLVRAQARRAELAARAALGATRGRLVQQLLTETLVLFLAAAPLSALTASWLVDIFRDYTVPANSTFANMSLRPDAEAWLFCVAVAGVAGLLSGLLPALSASRVDLLSVLKQSSAGASVGRGQTRLRGGLIVAQVALAFALLSGAGVALEALNRVLSIPPGFQPEGLVMGRLIGIPDKYATSEERLGLALRIMERLASTPGVIAVAGNDALPLSGYDAEAEFEIEGRLAASQESLLASRNTVSSGYLDTMGMRLLRGRDLLPSDDPQHPPVALVNRALAERYFPGQDPIGHRLRHASHDGEAFREIVGVVDDVRRYGLGASVRPETFTPLAQANTVFPVIVARAERPDELLRALPAIVDSVEPALGIWTHRMDRLVMRSVDDSISVAVLLGAFAVVALGLATLGLYALVSYSMSLKTREFGIRSALGSPPALVAWLVVKSGLGLLGLGSALGVVGSLLLGRVIAVLVPGARSFDPAVYAGVALALGAAGALATFVPARRAVRTSPAVALRYE